MDPESEPDARGTVVATSWQSVSVATTELLRMTRDFGFALYDPQRLRLYDPRDHIDIDVELGDGTQVPYLSERLLAGLFDHPDPRWPWLIVRRAEHHYIQSNFMEGRAVVISIAAAGPTNTSARQPRTDSSHNASCGTGRPKPPAGRKAFRGSASRSARIPERHSRMTGCPRTSMTRR